MPATGRVKYFIAFIVGLTAAVFYIVLSFRLNVKVEGAGAALLFSAAAGAIVCFFLAYDITCHNRRANGKLHEERFALVLALMFPTFFGVQSVIDTFANLERRAEQKTIEWIIRKWGENGDCELSTFAVRPGEKERQLIFETDGQSFTRMIIGTPTVTSIRTDHGIYRMRNGIMTTTEEGFETKKFETCD